MRAQLCRLHLSSEVLAAMTRHLQVFAACTGAVDQAPTDRASLRLLHSASRRRRQGVCSSLPLAVEFRVVAAMTRHLPARCSLGLCTRAAIKLRLIEQACDCSTVRVGGGCKVHARVCRWHSDHAHAVRALSFVKEPRICSTVRVGGVRVGGGGKVRAYLCRLHLRLECLPP